MENKTNQFSQDDQNLEDEPFEKTENVQSNEQTEDNQAQQKQLTEESNSSDREDQEIEQMLQKFLTIRRSSKNLGIKKFSGIEIKVNRILLAEFNKYEAKMKINKFICAFVFLHTLPQTQSLKQKSIDYRSIMRH